MIKKASPKDFTGSIEDAKFVDLGAPKSTDFSKDKNFKVSAKSGVMVMRQGVDGICKAFCAVAMPILRPIGRAAKYLIDKDMERTERKAHAKHARKDHRSHIKELKKKVETTGGKVDPDLREALKGVRAGLSKEDKKFMDKLLKLDPRMETSEVRQSIATVELLQKISENAQKTGRPMSVYLSVSKAKAVHLADSNKPVSLNWLYKTVKELGGRVQTNNIYTENRHALA